MTQWQQFIQHTPRKAPQGSWVGYYGSLSGDVIPDVVFQSYDRLCPKLNELSLAAFPPPYTAMFPSANSLLIVNSKHFDHSCMVLASEALFRWPQKNEKE